MADVKNIHDGHRERMCEKLLKGGDLLSDCEILEILLFRTLPRVNTNPIAHQLLLKFGTLEKVFSAKEEELCLVEGVGRRVARDILLIGQIVRRTDQHKSVFPKVSTPHSVRDFLIGYFKGMRLEKILILYVDEKFNVRHSSIIEGDSSQFVEMDLSGFFRDLSVEKPHAVLIAHNHPSGFPFPSEADDDLTKKISLILSMQSIRFYDHIVVAGDEIFSYKAAGRLDKIQSQANVQRLDSYIKSLD